MTSFAVIVCQKATKRGLDYWCNHLRPRVIYLLKDVQRIDFRALGHLPLYLDSRIWHFRWPILVLPRGDVDPVSLPSQVLGEADVCMFNPQMLIFPVGALFKDMQACLCHIPLTLFDAGGRLNTLLVRLKKSEMVILGVLGGTENCTSGARIKILRPLFNTNTPPKTPI